MYFTLQQGVKVTLCSCSLGIKSDEDSLLNKNACFTQGVEQINSREARCGNLSAQYISGTI